jgi:O-antigen/teichoic acid export membrane protein
MMENRRLARNAVWNLLSLAAPMLVALGAIPVLIRTLGIDRFGILTLAWMLIGYCSLFDLGLGRALTKLVSEGFGEEISTNPPRTRLARAVWTALVLMVVFGCVGGLIFASASTLLATSALKVPAALRAETVVSLHWIAAAIPLVTLTAGLRGILEARQHFGSLSLLRTATGVLTFVGPLLAARSSGSLSAVIFTIAAIRLLSAVGHFILCAVLAPELLSDRHVIWREVRPLFRFGAWLTISNLISPLMVSIDRFLIGMFLSVAEVGYYATPYEIVTKLQIIPSALTGVLFPALSATLVNDRARARQLYTRGLAITLALLLPLTVVMVTFAHAGLALWLGPEFAMRGYRVLQLLSIGVLINASAYLPASFLHAAGRPDVTAKLHMIEFPLYIPLVCWFIRAFGIEGAASAWVLRVTLDAALLFWMAERAVPKPTLVQWEIANAGPAPSA